MELIGICPFRLQARVPLEAVPDAVFGVDGVIDLDHDQVLAIAVVQRPLLLGCAAVSVGSKRASCNLHQPIRRERQQREHILIERNLRGFGLKVGAGDRISTADCQLTEHILLIGRGRQGRWRHDWQCDANALIVPEEEQLVPADRPAHAHAEFIDHVERGLVAMLPGVSSAWRK